MARVYYKSLQLDQVRSFCRVARLGSFAAAADELGLSPPTVWRQVRALERDCQATLVIRNGRNVQLTREGRLALELLEPHLAGIDSVRDLLHAQIAKLPRQLTVASTSMLFLDFLAEPVRQYLAAEPDVSLSLRNEPADQALARVLAGDADVGVVTYLLEEPREPQVIYQDLRELPWMLATPAGHPLSKKRGLRLEDLAEYPWIMPAGETQPRRHLEAVLRRAHLLERVRIVLESRTFALTETYVKMGLGISVWYGAEARKGSGLWLRPATEWFGATPVAVVRRRGRHLPAHVLRFIHIVQQCLGSQA
jgi:DNA-binding transcriptional LysR family regulator